MTLNLKIWTQWLTFIRLSFDSAFSLVCFCSVESIQAFQVTFNFLVMISHVIKVDFLRQDWCVVIVNLLSSRGHKNSYSSSLVEKAFVLTVRLAFQQLQTYAIDNSNTVSTTAYISNLVTHNAAWTTSKMELGKTSNFKQDLCYPMSNWLGRWCLAAGTVSF